MIDTVLDVTIPMVEQYGLAVLFVVFVFEGAVIGKLVPTRAIFLAVVLAVGAGWFGLASIALAAVAGGTLGQGLLFFATRRATGRLQVEADEDESAHVRSSRGRRWFDRWGLAAVVVSNALPLVRGTLTVPTALSGRSGYRFAAASTVGTIGYVALLLAIAAGIDGAVELIG